MSRADDETSAAPEEDERLPSLTDLSGLSALADTATQLQRLLPPTAAAAPVQQVPSFGSLLAGLAESHQHLPQSHHTPVADQLSGHSSQRHQPRVEPPRWSVLYTEQQQQHYQRKHRHHDWTLQRPLTAASAAPLDDSDSSDDGASMLDATTPRTQHGNNQWAALSANQQQHRPVAVASRPYQHRRGTTSMMIQTTTASASSSSKAMEVDDDDSDGDDDDDDDADGSSDHRDGVWYSQAHHGNAQQSAHQQQQQQQHHYFQQHPLYQQPFWSSQLLQPSGQVQTDGAPLIRPVPRRPAIAGALAGPHQQHHQQELAMDPPFEPPPQQQQQQHQQHLMRKPHPPQVWTSDLHRRYVDARNALLAEGRKASPKRVLQRMAADGCDLEATGLDTRRVRSHQQKYLLSLQSPAGASRQLHPVGSKDDAMDESPTATHDMATVPGTGDSLNEVVHPKPGANRQQVRGLSRESSAEDASGPMPTPPPQTVLPDEPLAAVQSPNASAHSRYLSTSGDQRLLGSSGSSTGSAGSADSGSSGGGGESGGGRDTGGVGAAGGVKPFQWSKLLHDHFEKAYYGLTGEGMHPSPKRVMDRMRQNGAEMSQLTLRRVQSHHQKFLHRLASGRPWRRRRDSDERVSAERNVSEMQAHEAQQQYRQYHQLRQQRRRQTAQHESHQAIASGAKALHAADGRPMPQMHPQSFAPPVAAESGGSMPSGSLLQPHAHQRPHQPLSIGSYGAASLPQLVGGLLGFAPPATSVLDGDRQLGHHHNQLRPPDALRGGPLGTFTAAPDALIDWRLTMPPPAGGAAGGGGLMQPPPPHMVGGFGAPPPMPPFVSYMPPAFAAAASARSHFAGFDMMSLPPAHHQVPSWTAQLLQPKLPQRREHDESAPDSASASDNDQN